MKMILLIIVLIGMYENKSMKKNGHKKMSPTNEKRMNTYGKLTTDEASLKKLLGWGLTKNYQQMLQDPKNYFISKGLTTYNGKIDLNQNVILSHKPHQTNLGYTYGEIEEEDKEKTAREAFTTNYDEMLTNPQKKVLVLGMHPELQTDNTRTLENQMEDPVYFPSPETLLELKQEQQKKLSLQEQKIAKFVDIIDKELNDNKQISDKQSEILSNLQSFMKSNDNQSILKYQNIINSLVDRIHNGNKRFQLQQSQQKQQQQQTLKNNSQTKKKLQFVNKAQLKSKGQADKKQKTNKIEQAMRLLSTLETVQQKIKSGNQSEKEKDFKIIQQQQEELEKSLELDQQSNGQKNQKKSQNIKK